jgi:hypothetical protein
MDELKRLGRRDAYRLGILRAQGAGLPAPRLMQPSFLPRHRGPAPAWALGLLGGIAAITAASVAGLWFVPFLAGAAAGLAGWLGRWRTRAALGAAAAMAFLGWAVSLGLAAHHGLLPGTSLRVLAPLPGVPARTAGGVGATLLAGCAEALAGCWAGLALAPRAARWLWL